MVGALGTMETTTTKKRATDRPMKVVGRKYASVSDLVRDTSDVEFADDFDKYQADRQLVNCLTVIRCTNELSQAKLAERMGCFQSKISKMESSVDADLNFGDVIKYAMGLKQGVHITFSPLRKNGADHIRFHIECIKHELDRLVKIAGNDPAFGNGIEAFAIEQVQNMVQFVDALLDKLPHRIHQSSGGVAVEAEGEHGERLPLDMPKRSRKTPKKAAPVA
jgi:transcriptional regulator with XRE-family HTH domain